MNSEERRRKKKVVLQRDDYHIKVADSEQKTHSNDVAELVKHDLLGLTLDQPAGGAANQNSASTTNYSFVRVPLSPKIANKIETCQLVAERAEENAQEQAARGDRPSATVEQARANLEHVLSKFRLKGLHVEIINADDKPIIAIVPPDLSRAVRSLSRKRI
ncbi:MAG: hypothetical protein JWO38_1211 [Gemmataceae bacterium]|nr:hypothetical protein [Gemmataceae bacterium]